MPRNNKDWGRKLRKRRLKEQSINETKNWFLEKINKIDKLLVKLTKQKGQRPKLIKLVMKKGYHNKYQ
jgi:hypothetical protein